VGHQIDFVISDFVADLRAPTPSAAAQMVVQKSDERLEDIKSDIRKLSFYFLSLLEHLKQGLKAKKESYGFRRPFDLITQRAQKVDERGQQFADGIKNYFEIKAKAISLLKEKLDVLSPASILKRGYSITRKLPELRVIKDAGILRKEDRVEVKVYRGRIESRVELIDLN